MTDSLTVVQGREQQPSKNAQAKILLSSRCVNFAWFVIIVGKNRLYKNEKNNLKKGKMHVKTTTHFYMLNI